MPKTMLIDAYHPEETRVAVCQGGKVEDFDFEYASRKPLRGNIYLARVTRVEPSLQAAFVEYGGNRHGFLAFSEIHPDYYQIPVADREVLRKAEALEVELAKKLAELNQDADADDIDPDEDDLSPKTDLDEAQDVDQDDTEAGAADTGDGEELPADYAPGTDEQDTGEWHGADESLLEVVGAPSDAASTTDDDQEQGDAPDASAALDIAIENALRSSEDEVVVNAEDASADEDGTASSTSSADGEKDGEQELSEEELAARERQKEIDELRARYEEAKRERNRLLRAYKIQEVIKRRQIMLVQVVKEERGNKGAALTTYLSLAGRYGVLMPNTARGGGISRKITSQSDRKRLKKAMSELDIAPNMGLIIRTAGAKRSKTEIKRDYDYLNRLWETIREKTLESVAPALIYEEASLMKRAIRDLYDKDTEQIIVQGDEGYREAKDFMKMLMPSHAKNVQRYKSDIPIFLKYKVEQQLDEMFQPVVQLKSGGYLVIQQTEALVSIDVNSGKATKERNVEQTALKTNSEAAVEVARQCRLRDLAGLIVVDFIDMEENRNNRAVEKKLKDAMKNDRARTQIGSISSFGLLEMSRQRRRSGIVDGTTQACPVCEGAGHVRSHEMAALRILRAAEGEAATGKHGLITVKTSTDVALYILNTKRAWLDRIEKVYGVKANVLADSGKFGDQYEVAASGSPSEAVSLKDTIGDDGPLSDFEAPELPGDKSAKDSDTASSSDDEDSDDKPKRRRRRRRRRKGDAEDRAEDGQENAKADDEDGQSSEDATDEAEAKTSDEVESADEDADGEPKRRRRRGRRGGRRNRRKSEAANENGENAGDNGDADDQSADGSSDDQAAAKADDGAEPSEEPKTEAPVAEAPAEDGKAAEADATAEPANDEGQTESADDAPSTEATEPAEVEATEAEDEPEPEPQPEEAPRPAAISREDTRSDGPRRQGWWQRAFNKN
ncbi:ribonuclease E/G [Parvularcula lutaonensis]|uniref:Ribonuclease E n=1 Tax=Parvularcula lutaonensis TaxID=491923 RepID=A0ABV7M773_9PROT|nr:Rne/Rng family ribonuclease [Parvularcula lutaonensis]GGY41483.1 ribonuclease E [Parvularcula lutaonensis]